MTTLQTRTLDRRREAEVSTVVNALFERWPALLGFCLREDGELFLTDLAVHPWFDDGLSKLGGEIALVLSDLIDEEPGARELLSGRTFARTVH